MTLLRIAFHLLVTIPFGITLIIGLGLILGS